LLENPGLAGYPSGIVSWSCPRNARPARNACAWPARARAGTWPGLVGVLGTVLGCQWPVGVERFTFSAQGVDAGADASAVSLPEAGAVSLPDAGPDSGSADALAPLCTPCELPHALASCSSEGCAVASCVGPWRDENGNADDGCETGDVPVGGLSLWFMADRGVTESDGFVLSWEDQSPNRSAAVPDSPSAMPELESSDEGFPLLHFDGVDDALSLPSGFARFDGTAFFAVVEALPNALCAGLLHFSNDPGLNDVEFGRHNPNRLYYEVGTQPVEGGSGTFEVGRRLLVSIVQVNDGVATGDGTPSSGTVQLHIDGRLNAEGSINLPETIERRENFVGRNNYEANQDVCSMFFHGRIGELLFYQRGVSSDERQRIEAYLQEKWQLGNASAASQ
jgi:hypothetical protein